MTYFDSSDLTATNSTTWTVCDHNTGVYSSVPFTVFGVEIGRTKFFWCEICLNALTGKEYKKIRNR